MDKHFVVFAQTHPHAVVWLLRGPSLKEALISYTLTEVATLNADGLLVSNIGMNKFTTYSHPIAAIEDDWKAYGQWHIREITEQHWHSPTAEVFCGEDSSSIKELIEICRPLTKQPTNRQQAAFVWYLREGPLVCFYKRRPSKRYVYPIEVTGRFLVSRPEYQSAVRWEGTYEDILNHLDIDLPPESINP